MTGETRLAIQPTALPEALARHGYPREAVEALTALKAEPAWLRQKRLEAWLIAEGTPFPSRKQEQWRYTDLRALAVEKFAAFAPGRQVERTEALPEAVQRALAAGWPRGGLLVQHNSISAYQDLNQDLAHQGVIFTDLERAVREHPHLVMPYLGSAISPRDGRLPALNLALWSGGTFLYVPANVEVALPLQALTWIDTSGFALFPRTLIIADTNSAVTFLDHCISPELGAPAFVHSVVEVIVGAGARVWYTTLQEWGPEIIHVANQRTLLESDATVVNTTVGLGARWMKASVETVLRGKGARAELYGVTFGEREQTFDFDTLQEHIGERTTSDLLFKTALKERARAVYWGLVRVNKTARGADANQENRNLLLSDQAKADSTPVLEIELSDIQRCSHAATVGPVDEEQLFYLQSRGIPYQDALHLLVEGFFAEVIERTPVEALRGPLLERVRAKLSD